MDTPEIQKKAICDELNRLMFMMTSDMYSPRMVMQTWPVIDKVNDQAVGILMGFHAMIFHLFATLGIINGPDLTAKYLEAVKTLSTKEGVHVDPERFEFVKDLLSPEKLAEQGVLMEQIQELSNEIEAFYKAKYGKTE